MALFITGHSSLRRQMGSLFVAAAALRELREAIGPGLELYYYTTILSNCTSILYYSLRSY